MTLHSFRKLFFAATIIASLFTACSKEDELPVKPSFTAVEIGADNSKIAYAGSDLHIDAKLAAPGTITGVRLEIRPATGSGWSYDSLYTEGFRGLKNADFHKHIDIPASAPVGRYQLHLTVTDQRGQKTVLEEAIEVKADASLPTVTGLSIELENGRNELHVEGTITAPNKIARVEIEIHGPWEKEFSYTDAAMVGQTTYHFHKHVDIAAAPSGHYHLHLKVIDQAGKEREFEDHFDK